MTKVEAKELKKAEHHDATRHSSLKSILRTAGVSADVRSIVNLHVLKFLMSTCANVCVICKID